MESISIGSIGKNWYGAPQINIREVQKHAGHGWMTYDTVFNWTRVCWLLCNLPPDRLQSCAHSGNVPYRPCP